jgi:hypothetical protein
MNALFLADAEPAAAKRWIEQAGRRSGFNPSHHMSYFLGCAWARMRRPREAVRALREAAETGFPCRPLLESDSNLDPIRDSREFQGFLAEIQQQNDALREKLFPGRS